MLEINQIHHGDCLELMHEIPDGSVDMVLADLPYGTTACAWDSIIDLDLLWGHYKRIIKPRGAIVLTADEPFTSVLVLSNLEWFRYKAIWKKSRPSDFANAKGKPLSVTEDVLLFSPATFGNGSLVKMIYNPQGVKPATKLTHKRQGGENDRHRPGRKRTEKSYLAEWTNYPVNVFEFSSVQHRLHPTQKPVALFAYLIRTYSNPGDLILDNAAGSGTTAIAAIQTGRNWLCIEKDADIYATAANRIAKALGQGFTPAARAGQPNNQNQAEFLQRGLCE